MKSTLLQTSFIVFIFSAMIYATGRWIVRNLISDDTGDWFLWSGGVSAMVFIFSKIGEVSAKLDVRRGINTAGALVLLFLSAFGGWGLLTESGKMAYEEMAGLIPFYALLLAGGIFILLVIFNLMWGMGSKKRSN